MDLKILAGTVETCMKKHHSHIGINSVLPNSEQNPYNSTITCRDQKGLLTHTALGAIWSKYEEFNG